MALGSALALVTTLGAGCGNGGGTLPPGLFAPDGAFILPVADSGPLGLPDGPVNPPTDGSVPSDSPQPPPPLQAPELGNGQPGSATMVEIVSKPAGLNQPRDLAFNTLAGRESELWIVNMKDDGMVIVQDTTSESRRPEKRIDGYALHFMAKPSSISFGQDAVSDRVILPGDAAPRPGTFATCQESRNTYDDQAAPNDFMGPALWSSDLGIFAEQNPHMLGSHLDMLHNSPLCLGIEWEGGGNVYWTVNGKRENPADPGFDVVDNAIIRYDFKSDDGIGNDNHRDGESFIFAAGQTAYVAGVPSHLAFDRQSRVLYIADTGNGRIARLDTTRGTPDCTVAVGCQFGAQCAPTAPDAPTGVCRMADAEGRRAFFSMTDTAPVEDLATGLMRPSGLELRNGLLYVSDNGTSEISAFDLTGQKVNAFATGLPAGSLAGLAFGPDGKLYFVDMVGDRVFRLDALTP